MLLIAATPACAMIAALLWSDGEVIESFGRFVLACALVVFVLCAGVLHECQDGALQRRSIRRTIRAAAVATLVIIAGNAVLMIVFGAALASCTSR